VVPQQEMVAKVRAACDAHRGADLLIIARTDALQPCGWDDAERRARAYREAGAALIFVDDFARRRVEAAIARVYAEGRCLTPDQGGDVRTTEFCAAVAQCA
jgi:2-methylisocitrate lyase-like PEP mutase family enzyme